MAKHKEKHKNLLLYYWKAAFHHLIFQVVILIGAIYVLFSSDIEVMLSYTPRHIVIEIRTFWLAVFLFEFISSILLETNFFNSIYFYIDFIDIISLVTEVHSIWSAFLVNLDNNTM